MKIRTGNTLGIFRQSAANHGTEGIIAKLLSCFRIAGQRDIDDMIRQQHRRAALQEQQKAENLTEIGNTALDNPSLSGQTWAELEALYNEDEIYFRLDGYQKRTTGSRRNAPELIN